MVIQKVMVEVILDKIPSDSMQQESHENDFIVAKNVSSELDNMIEIFHSTSDLRRILGKGLKSIYQLGLEGKGNCDLYLSPEEIDKPDTPRITQFLYKSLFFFDRCPAGDEWVSILVDETDEAIKVGNINLVDSPHQPGRFYEKSLMVLPTYLRRRNEPYETGKDFENPLYSKNDGL